MKLSNSFLHLYIECDGKLFKVVHIAKTIDEANDYCRVNLGCGVIDQNDSGIFIAEHETCAVVYRTKKQLKSWAD